MGNDKQLNQYIREKEAIEKEVASLQMQLTKLNVEYLKIEGKIELLKEQKEAKQK